jgi:hypothetical protein
MNGVGNKGVAMRTTNGQLRIGLVAGAIVAVCVGVYLVRSQREVPESPREPERVEEDSVPINLTDDGWRLTRDCTLAIEAPAYVETSATGKFISAPSFGLVPTNRAVATYTVRPTVGTDVRLFFTPVPLKVSKMVAISEGKQLLTERDETEVTVTTLVIREGTRIMPDQRIEIVDRSGKVVWKQPG